MPLTVDHVRDLYEDLAFGDFCYAAERAGYYPLFDEFVSLIGPDSRVCDVGCGAGFWLDAFVRLGVREDQLLGIDLAPSHVLLATRRGHRAICGNVLALELPTASVDFTFCAGVIHHTPDPTGALRELARITRPGGCIYLAVYNKWHPYFWLVHKATAPLRALHWKGWKRLSRACYRIWTLLVQPVSLIVYRRRLDERTCRALFMDQVLTPYAHLFSTTDVKREADAAGLDVVEIRHALWSLMIVAILRVREEHGHG